MSSAGTKAPLHTVLKPVLVTPKQQLPGAVGMKNMEFECFRKLLGNNNRIKIIKRFFSWFFSVSCKDLKK